VPNALGFKRVFVAQERRYFAIDEFPQAVALRAASKAIAGYARISFYGGEEHIRDDLFFEQRRSDRNAVQCRLNVGDLQKTLPPLAGDDS